MSLAYDMTLQDLNNPEQQDVLWRVMALSPPMQAEASSNERLLLQLDRNHEAYMRSQGKPQDPRRIMELFNRVHYLQFECGYKGVDELDGLVDDYLGWLYVSMNVFESLGGTSGSLLARHKAWVRELTAEREKDPQVTEQRSYLLDLLATKTQGLVDVYPWIVPELTIILEKRCRHYQGRKLARILKPRGK